MAAPKRIWIIIAFAAVYLIWGSTYLGILLAIQSIPPFLMAGVRFFSAGVIMYGAATNVDRLARIDRRFYRSRNFGWARIHKFDRKSSGMGHVDLAYRVVTLVYRVSLLAQG